MTAQIPTGPSWEDQIVPTLRKRLENESAYLTHRLSSKNVTDPSAEPQSHPLYGQPQPFPGSSTVEGRPETHRDPSFPRHRTKSTPFAPSGPSSGRRPTQGTRSGSSRSNSASPTKDALDSDEVLREHALGNSVQPQRSIIPSDKHRETLPPSRIPTRPRSKSQLGPRPRLQDTHSNDAPLLPSGIPRPSTSRRGSSPSKGDKLSASQVSSRRPSYRSESPDMLKGRNVEGLVKNELPPFMMFQEDAMRIAERGHDLDLGSEREYGFSAGSRRGQEVGNSGLSRSVGATEGESSKRQRSITMRPDSRSSLDMDTPTKRDQGRKAGIGLGQPSSSAALRKTATSNRSASSRTPQNQTTAQGSGFAPRSASLNLLSSTSMGVPSSLSSSRLGVAAHLVPPENTYTPPKGANWDEVVLPTVAKKLGMSEAEREEGEEGDLAVEWDKDGVPIKWVKKGILSTSQSSNAGLSVGGTNLTTSHSFSPTFEPSPDNPLRPSQNLSAPPRTHSQTNSLRHKPSDQSLDSTPVPIRTTRGHPTDLILEPPISPAPFSDLIPVPPGWQSQLKRKESGNSPGGIGRKPSLLRKQPSQLSIRSGGGTRASPRGGAGYGESSTGIMTPERAAGAGYFDNPRPAPAQPSHQGSSTELPRTGYGREHNRFGEPPSTTQARPSKGNKDGEHGKGCGCIIM